MSAVVQVRSFPAPPFNEREMLRYAGCREADEQVKAALDGCLHELGDRLSYRVCWCELPVSVEGDVCDCQAFSVMSSDLARVLRGCSRVIVMAATIGVEIDRLIARYGRLSPSKAILFQGIGTERIEALCDAFCADAAGERGMPRFSPGYGDLPLSVQRSVATLLGMEKTLGICLNDSLLMSPSKSVTAFVGVSDTAHRSTAAHHCAQCDLDQCMFRGGV